MPGTRPDSFNHALSTANTWLADVSAALGTGDRHFSRRALRAWLHTVRDRLTVDAVAKFGAQLPELMRGIYYDGWDPSRSPIKFGVDQYLQRFAWEARVPVADVPAIASAITSVMADRLSSGQLEEALAGFPTDLRQLLMGEATFPQPTAPPHRGDRFHALEDQISTLAEAVRSLARGLEDNRLGGVEPERAARGARLADEILMTIGR